MHAMCATISNAQLNTDTIKLSMPARVYQTQIRNNRSHHRVVVHTEAQTSDLKPTTSVPSSSSPLRKSGEVPLLFELFDPGLGAVESLAHLPEDTVLRCQLTPHLIGR